MRNKRNPWVLVILLILGSLIGGIGGEFLWRYPYFTWMSFGGANGYRDLFSFVSDPAIDMQTIRLGFNMALRINAGSIIGMLLGLIVYIKI